MDGPDTIRILLGLAVILACWVAANQVAEMGRRWIHWRKLLATREAVKAPAVQSQRAIMPPSTTISVPVTKRASSAAR